MIYFQLIILFVLMVVSYHITHHDYLSPGFIFSLGFCFSSLWACMYAQEWQLGLHDNTFLVIVGGVLLYVAISTLVHNHYYRKRRIFMSMNNNEPLLINISDWKLNLFIAFEIIILAAYVYFLLRRGSSGGNLAESIYEFRNERTTGEITESLPAILRLSNYILISAGYWFSYVLVNNYFVKKKITWKIVIIIGLVVASSLIEGGRNNSINVLLSIFVFMTIYRKRETAFKERLKPKMIVKVGLLASAGLYGMVYFAKVLGRKLLFTPMYYLATYCGAEIKNLDIFLNSARTEPAIWGEQTFVNLVKAVGGYFISNFDSHYAINPYQKVNGYYLANVYTTFKAYIHDFGYVGMIVLVIVMAIINQIVYEKALVAKNKKYPGLYCLLYGFLFNTILFSFFSNKFYENLFSLRFIRYLIFWYLFYFFFCKVRFVKKDRTGRIIR